MQNIAMIDNKNKLDKFMDKILRINEINVTVSDLRELEKIVRLLRFCYLYLIACQQFRYFRAKLNNKYNK